MEVLILHDHVGEDGGRPDEADTLVQADAVSAALRRLGHTVRPGAASLRLDGLGAALRARRPGMVFNLVESLEGRGSLIHLAPAVVEASGVPMSGCPASAIMLTSNKLLAKAVLHRAGLPTPAWLDPTAPLPGVFVPGNRWIVKSVWEHASVGLDEDSVVDAPDASALLASIESRLEALGGQGFAEHFIDGREFNLSLLERAGEATVLPPAEIVFEGYGPGRVRVVGYRAKWDERSDAYHRTPRRFEFPASDGPLLSRLSELALACWRLFGLRGYARVDFRVDDRGRPWILEVNTNPCLSPDAGYQAAATRAGLTLDGVIDALVSAAVPWRGALTRG